MSSRPTLTYRRPKQGRDYWVQDNILPNADEVSRRCYERTDWELGAPHEAQVWPGRRAPEALTPERAGAGRCLGARSHGHQTSVG